ncbi:MAG TPA: hypothetical protein DE315_08095 [Candidatus Omnitrophica bacterium]|nr:hypothetical protein [Candidatus Omnitrophota bacterium]
MDLENRTVTILGAQRTGMALAKLVARLDGKAKISDKAGEDAVSEDFRQWAKQHKVACEFRGHTRAFIEDSDFVVLSPGVPHNSEAVSWARARNILVLGEIEFAFQFCSKPVIAVTGSNGKTTVVTLIHQLLEAAGRRSLLCGNIGAPFSGQVLDLDGKDLVVLETSSFQLETVAAPGTPGVRGFKPYIAVVLNVNQNHLDRHKDFQEYFDAKKRIFLNQDAQDYAVLNFQDQGLKDLAPRLKAQVRFFNAAPPALAGVAPNPNFAVAREVANILGIKDDVCARVFRNFKGVEHRLELVRQIEGVNFINDSKATTAQAAIWALERLNAPVIMICGGRDKNIDFSVVAPFVRRKVKKMIIIGEARAKLKKTFGPVVALEECATLPDAVARASAIAQKGDNVLLSPMCASFDMFSNYEERGRCFKELVHSLPAHA